MRAIRGFCLRDICGAALWLIAALSTVPSIWALEFPQNEKQWLNSAPWTMKQAEGKVIFLYFFSEQDKETQEHWKEVLDLAKEYENRPVLFIAVNPGGSRDEMQRYVKQAGINWPVLVDTDKSFAKSFVNQNYITEVGPNNGMQLALINTNGTISKGAWSSPEDSLQDPLKSAKFNIDPTTVPDALRPVWFQLEYQNYAAASKDLKKYLKSSKEELKSGAEALLAAVTPIIAEKAQAADTAYEAGEKWPAYKGYAELSEDFKGYDIPENVEPRKKELQADAGVKGQLAALKTFDSNRKLVTNPSQKKKAMTALKKLIKDKPDTEAAVKAQALIDELES